VRTGCLGRRGPKSMPVARWQIILRAWRRCHSVTQQIASRISVLTCPIVLGYFRLFAIRRRISSD